MNTIILAGGYAERLWPLTTEYPKTLLRVAGKPVLYHLLDNLTHIPILKNIIIAIDENKKEYFKNEINLLNTYSKLRPQLSIHTLTKNNTPKGPLTKIIEIIKSNKFKTSNDKYFIIGGDNLFGFDLNNFVNFQKDTKSNCIASQTIKKKIDVSQFGVPKTDNQGRLTGFSEKPLKIYHQDRSTCCYILKHNDILKILDYLKSLRNKDDESLGLFIHSLISSSTIFVYKFKNSWFDIGTREELIAANSYLIESDPKRRNEPTIAESTDIIDYNYIHDTVFLSNSKIGPNVFIDNNVIIKNSTVLNSIIYENSIIHNSVIRNCILGPNSKVEGKLNEAVYGSH